MRCALEGPTWRAGGVTPAFVAYERVGGETSLKIAAAACTDVGKVRQHNEDASLVDLGLNLFAVADGLGGHQAGERASQLAVETLGAVARDWQQRGEAVGVDVLLEAFDRANFEILDDAANRPERRGMGTTLTAALIDHDRLWLGHVGDSRAWRLRDGELMMLTHDHTVVAQQMREGILTAEDARHHPMRHVLSRCLGVRDELEVDLLELDVAAEDVYVLASDGLEPGVRPEDIASILSETVDPETVARQLVDRACDRGGQDNVTVVVVRCQEA